MKGLMVGVVTMVLICAPGIAFALLGFVNMRADNAPSKLETTLAGHAMDASIARASPKSVNPITVNETNLIAGARLYRDHCSLCHGDPEHPRSALADSLNPPAPQFMNDAADMPENQNSYILEHGIRWSAMPSWETVLSEQQTWQTVTFLSHMRDLPPNAEQVFRETVHNTVPPSDEH